MLETRTLSKKYGHKLAINSIDLTVREGEIVGILGPNGSGKSSFMKIVAGLLRQTSGTVTLNGMAPSPTTKSFISYLSDTNDMPSGDTVEDVIIFYDHFFEDFDGQ